MPQQQIPTEPKPCRVCGRMMTRKRFPGGVLEEVGQFNRRRHCSLKCGNTRDIVGCSQYGKRARKYKGIQCEQCGLRKSLHIHHIDGNYRNNDPSNLQTLCGSCHLLLHWNNGTRKRKPSSPCTICGQPSERQGFCCKHYARYKTHGNPYLVKRGNGSGTYFVREDSDGKLYRC